MPVRFYYSFLVFFCFVFGHEIMHSLRALAVFEFFGMFMNRCLVLLLLLAGSFVRKFSLNFKTKNLLTGRWRDNLSWVPCFIL